MTNEINDFAASSFWAKGIKESDFTQDDSNINKINKMNSYRKAISQFVYILTGRKIPVRFKVKSDSSYTDGETVTLSGEISKDKFDSVVGLALHEASHIVLSDFEVLKNISDYVPIELKDKYTQMGLSEEETVKLLKNYTNFVEDRRIDRYTQDNAIGYVPYYKSLYKRYFINKTSKSILKSPLYRTETLESYWTRIFGLIEEQSDLNALKGLKEISKCIDLKNINRLKSSKESIQVAVKVMEIIAKYVDIEQQKKEKLQQDKEQKDGKPSKGDGKNSNKKMKIKIDDLSDLEGLDIKSDDDNDGSEDGTEVEIELSDKAKKQLGDLMEEQKKFLNGDTDKKPISDKLARNLEAIDAANSEVKEVNKNNKPNDVHARYRNSDVYDMDKTVIVLKSVNDKVFYSDVFPFSDKFSGRDNIDEVNEGITLGKILGKKLKIRNEEKKTVYSRIKNGHIDKRLLHAAEFSESIFQQTEIEKFVDSCLHITIDGSSSMQGGKWSQTIKTVTAIAKACDMTENIRLQISIRGATYTNNIVAIIYDSKFDKFDKLKRLMPDLKVDGSTPEGLCYEAIMEYLLESDTKLKSYFMNFSDGEPTYSNGIEHTKKQVEKIRSKGIKVISYFITNYQGGSSEINFKRMYGRDAQIIDVDNITNVARSINKKFSEE